MNSTIDPGLLHALNSFLGQELGRNVRGEPFFTWEWSEEMFWPGRATGRMLTEEVEVEIPLIGTGRNEKAIEQKLKPEYTRDRLVRERDVWLVAKWLTPWELILGPRSGHMRHGSAYAHEQEPPRAEVVQAWERQYPGVDFPSDGWRIPTNARLPREEGGKREPNWPDTRHFVQQVRAQASKSFDQVLREMDEEEARTEREKDRIIGDEIRDAFPALLNPVPGRRSNFVSFPWTRQDRAR